MTFDFLGFLEKAVKANASDIHLNHGKRPCMRVNKKIFKLSNEVITREIIKEILMRTLPDEYTKQIDELKDLDYVYEIKGLSRFRINYCRDIYNGKLTFRLVPYQVKSLDDLNLPEYLKNYTTFSNGIVIVTGATGSGKSTTLASLIDIINDNYKKHIVTLEDPVEFIYQEKKALITQRGLNINISDFKSGIKYALRQDPDVILVGEIRDKDTLLSAIEASETGHLVFSTLHTNGAVASINRLVGFVEEFGQQHFIKRLSECIRGIVHQALVPTVDEKHLIPAVELLTMTSTVVDYIKSGKYNEIYDLMKKTKQPNIFTMNSSLYNLYKEGKITKETALQYSLEKVEMEQLLRGIYHGSDEKGSIL